jgi:hypothetical protein
VAEEGLVRTKNITLIETVGSNNYHDVSIELTRRWSEVVFDDVLVTRRFGLLNPMGKNPNS